MSARRVGQRIHVYWVDETAWFTGIVQEFDAAQGYYVVYDDGDERWEALTESYRFDGQQESDSEESQEDDGEEDGKDDEQENSQSGESAGNAQKENATYRYLSLSDDEEQGVTNTSNPTETLEGGDDQGQGSGGSSSDDKSGSPVAPSYPKPIDLSARQLSSGESSGAVTAHDSHPGDGSGEDADDDDDDTRSVALTETPDTFEKVDVGHNELDMQRSARVRQPQRGILRGLVLRTNDLPLRSKTEDSVFVFTRIAFVEAMGTGNYHLGSSNNNSHAMMMLRCKQVLAMTRRVEASTSPEFGDPVWNHLENSEDYANEQQEDGMFQLEVAPPTTGPTQLPAWLQLKGGLLFSVYASEDASGRHGNEFIGQASIQLAHVMRDILMLATHAPLQNTLSLPLESRQGRSIGRDAEIVVSFRFEPIEVPFIRQRMPSSRSRTDAEEMPQPGSRSTGMRRSPLSVSSTARSRETTHLPSTARMPDSSSSISKRNNRACKQPEGKQTPLLSRHESSSAINRRRQERKIDRENEAMAKRVAQQRKLKRSALAPRSEAKSVMRALPRGAAKMDGIKATSAINRGRFHEQVKQENSAMEKRRTAITRGGGGSSRYHADFADAKTKSNNSDFLAFDSLTDKAYVANQRLERQREKDFIAQRAQTTYHKQHELVQTVAMLQEQLSEWKARVFQIKSSLNRVSLMNKKDTHVRDCLRNAVRRAKTLQPVPVGARGHTSSHAIGKFVSCDEEDRNNTDDDDGTSYPSAQDKNRREWKKLYQEAADMQHESEAVEQRLLTLTQQENDTEMEVVECHRQWQRVQSARAFHRKLAATPALAAAIVGASTSAPSSATGLQLKKQAMRLCVEITAEDEEQAAIYSAQQQLTQLRIAVTLLKEKLTGQHISDDVPSAGQARLPSSKSSSAALCEYLQQKLVKRRATIDKLEQDRCEWQCKYDAMVASGDYEHERRRVHELQQLLFLCQCEAKHVAAAERAGRHMADQLERDAKKQMCKERNETEILFGSKRLSG